MTARALRPGDQLEPVVDGLVRALQEDSVAEILARHGFFRDR